MPLPITNMQLNMPWGISGANGGGEKTVEGGDVGTSWFEAENWRGFFFCGSKVLSRFGFFERRGFSNL